MISKIDHVVIFVSDMDKAIDFYTNTLGLSLGYSSPEYTAINLDGETSIGLHIADQIAGAKSGKATTEVSFLVKDIEKAYEELKSKQVTIVRDIVEIAPGRMMFDFVDPDNNRLSCYQVTG